MRSLSLFLALTLISFSFVQDSFGANANSCRRSGGSWNSFQRKCFYRGSRTKKKSYNNYNSRYKKKTYNAYKPKYKKKTYNAYKPKYKKKKYNSYSSRNKNAWSGKRRVKQKIGVPKKRTYQARKNVSNYYNQKKAKKFVPYKKKYTNNYKTKPKTRSVTSTASKTDTKAALSGKTSKDALLFCWQNKKRTKWSCDGPLQKALTFWKTLDQAKGIGGCRSTSSRKNWSSGDKSGYLFNCGRKLKTYNRDIRGKYGIR